MAEPNVLRDRIAAAILSRANSSLNSNDWLYEHDAENYADAVMAVVDAALDQAVAAGRRQAADAIRAELEDQRGARRVAADAVDRFRDNLSDALGYDENPGDDMLMTKLREHFGKSGPEPTRWRNALVAYEAMRDQINAARITEAAPAEPVEEAP